MEQRYVDLYEEYLHGFMERRTFMDKLVKLAGSTAAASAILPLIENKAWAAEILPNDPRVTTETVSIPGFEGLTGYLAKPNPMPKARVGGIVVIGENRGVTPYIEDICRHYATEGFIALGVDYLSHGGGTPIDEDVGAQMVGKLKPGEALNDFRLGAQYLKTRADVGKVGSVGYCWGGALVNQLAVAEPNLDAAVGYYGTNPDLKEVPKMNAALLEHYAGLEERTLLGIPAFEDALKKAGKTYHIYIYPRANHGFTNDLNPSRYDRAATELAWQRTTDWFHKYLG